MTKLSELEALLFIVGEEGISNEELSGLLNLSEAEVTSLVKELKNLTLKTRTQLCIFLKRKAIMY